MYSSTYTIKKDKSKYFYNYFVILRASELFTRRILECVFFRKVRIIYTH